MGEIANDHYSRMRWEQGFDWQGLPPSEHPIMGGLDSFIANRIRAPRTIYSCKFCGDGIQFVNKVAYSQKNGARHQCLKERAAQAAKQGEA